MQKNKILIGFGVLIVAYAFVSTALLKKPIEENDPTIQTLKRWMSYEFIDINSSERLEAINKTPIFLYNNPDLNLIKLSRNTIQIFLDAFSAGSFEKYAQFRYPIEYSLIESNCNNLILELSDITVDQPVMSFPPKWAVDQNYFTQSDAEYPILPGFREPLRTNQNSLKNFPNLMYDYFSNHTGYKEYFQKFSHENSYISIQRLDKIPAPLQKLAKEEDNVSLVISGTPYIRTRVTHEATLRKQGYIDITTIRILIQLKAPDTIVPFYVRYFHLPEENKLIPYEFLRGNAMIATHVSAWF